LGGRFCIKDTIILVESNGDWWSGYLEVILNKVGKLFNVMYKDVVLSILLPFLGIKLYSMAQTID
jgi:hypothetical protein